MSPAHGMEICNFAATGELNLKADNCVIRIINFWITTEQIIWWVIVYMLVILHNAIAVQEVYWHAVAGYQIWDLVQVWIVFTLVLVKEDGLWVQQKQILSETLVKSKFWFVNVHHSVCVYMHTNSHLQCSLLELFSFICHS